MRLNTENQSLHVIAFDERGRVSGESANITCTISIDGGSRVDLTDTNPIEIETTGEYVFDLTQSETNGHELSFTPVCSTSGVQVLAMPSNVIYTLTSAQEISNKVTQDLLNVTVQQLLSDYSSGDPNIAQLLLKLYESGVPIVLNSNNTDDIANAVDSKLGAADSAISELTKKLMEAISESNNNIGDALADAAKNIEIRVESNPQRIVLGPCKTKVHPLYRK